MAQYLVKHRDKFSIFREIFNAVVTGDVSFVCVIE